MPDDWDNRKMIPDPNDFKPAEWDDRAIIPDPDAKEPPEWREHIQGKWTPPYIQNPDYLGVWKPKMIHNPNYMGEWAPRLIPNPAYVEDEKFGVFEDLAYVAIEVYQDSPGSIFDNILVTDDIAYAEKRLRENFLQLRDDEFTMYKRVLQDKAAEEELRKLREKDSQQLTDQEFYTSSSSTDRADVSEASEDERHFVFPSVELSDPPSIEDFEFPYDVAHNRYFLERGLRDSRMGSVAGRRKWKEHRDRKRMEMELPEDVNLSD
jgi:calreticulin